MSLADRDWYRDEIRKRHVFARSPDWKFRVFVAIGLAVVLTGIWKVRGIGRPAASETPKVVVEPDGPMPARPSVAFQERPPAAIALPPETIYRCVVDGQVVYSGPRDCRGTSSVFEPSPSTVDGAPARLTAYQREMLRSADARIARDAADARAGIEAIAMSRDSGGFECDAVDTELRSIDARARQPISAHEHDVLRARRQVVTSRKHALRC